MRILQVLFRFGTAPPTFLIMAEHASHDHTADDHTAHDHTDPGARVIQRHCDVAVIGGSAAGLAAALQLARQRRTVIAVDDGTPRNAPAEHMHGYLGREGIAPSDLVAIGREEVRSYGGEILTGRALAVRKHDDGFLVELTGGHSLVARRVLAATGVADELPDIDGLAPRWGKDVVNCPFCHGFEVRDQRLVQIVTHPMALHPTPLFRQLTDRLTVVVHQPQGVDDAAVARLVEAGVPVIRERVVRIVSGPDASVAGVELADGRVLEADAVVAGSRFHGRADAFAPAGVTTTPHPTGMGDVVEVDAAGQTAVPGIYAAGNLTDPSLQVLPSAAHGSRVGAMIAFSLADEDLRAGVRPSGAEADWDHRYSDEDRMWSANPNGTLTREVTGLTPGRALDVGAGEGRMPSGCPSTAGRSPPPTSRATPWPGCGRRPTAGDCPSTAYDATPTTGRHSRPGVSIWCRCSTALSSARPTSAVCTTCSEPSHPAGPCSSSAMTSHHWRSRSTSQPRPGCSTRARTSASRRSWPRSARPGTGRSRSTTPGTGRRAPPPPTTYATCCSGP
ncbi:hypothetical protein GCM10027613_03700 [Microlunatus endophyticus]